MTNRETPAWYVYAVLPGDAALPECSETILPGAALDRIAQAGAATKPVLAALVSAVPQELFLDGNPDSRAADPDWVAARAVLHHAVVAQCHAAGPCMPLGFGTLFSSRQAVQTWLRENDEGFRAALAAVAGRQEWAVALTEHSEAHATWLRQSDTALRKLATEIDTASAGLAFLLGRRFAKAVAAARAAHLGVVAERIGKRLTEACATLPEASASGAATSWCVLCTPNDGIDALLDNIAGMLSGMGLALRVTGPWPPYAFARAACQRHAHG